MKTKFIKISDKAREELAAATISGNQLIFPDRVTKYAEIKKLFPTLGITWNKKEKVHYVEDNGAKLLAFLKGDEKIIDEKKTRQAFYTPKDLAARVVKMAKIGGNDLVLEPSCGNGRLVEEIIKYTPNIHIIEIDEPTFTNTIQSYNVVGWNMDFLLFDSEEGYDKIIMNSPYDKNIWVKHLEHAFVLLKNGGKLTAICPNAQHNKFFQEFINNKEHDITEVESGAFKESGTNIATMIVEVWK